MGGGKGEGGGDGVGGRGREGDSNFVTSIISNPPAVRPQENILIILLQRQAQIGLAYCYIDRPSILVQGQAQYMIQQHIQIVLAYIDRPSIYTVRRYPQYLICLAHILLYIVDRPNIYRQAQHIYCAQISLVYDMPSIHIVIYCRQAKHIQIGLAYIDRPSI